MSGFSVLEVGKRALLAQRFGLDVTSNNVANVNTPGYSRRTALFSETDPINYAGKFLGTGVVVEKLRTYREELFDKEVRNSISRQSNYETDEQIIQRIESMLGEPSETGMNDAISKLFNSFEEVSLNPENNSLREQLLSNAQMLVERFHGIGNHLLDFREDIRGNIINDVNQVNSLLDRIAKLNGDISLSKAESGAEAQTLVDERENVLEELAKYINIKVSPEDNGSVNVFVNGINLITDNISKNLKVDENINNETGERTISLTVINDKNLAEGSADIQSGELFSLLKHFNVTFDSEDSSGEYSIFKNLNQFASTLVEKVNGITINGYGLDDTGTSPPGRYFFEPSSGNVTALNIELSNDVKNKPRNVPLSGAPGEHGNNDIALLLTRLATDKSFFNGQTPSEYYSSFLAKIGTMGNEAQNGRSTSKLVSEQLIKQRESIIGVNLDEEAINLVKFQKAFDASARVINTANEMLSTIINLGV